MRRNRWPLRAFSKLVAAVILVGLSIGPDVVGNRMEAILVDSWNAAGGALLRHDLSRLDRGLDSARAELQTAKAGRDDLARCLYELETRRQAASKRFEQDCDLLERIHALLDRLPEGAERIELEREADSHLQRSLDTSRELEQLDAATLAVTEQLQTADRQIRAAQDRLSVRESELALLRASDEARKLRQDIARVGDVPTSWQTRARRADGLLQPLRPASAFDPSAPGVGRLTALAIAADHNE